MRPSAAAGGEGAWHRAGTGRVMARGRRAGGGAAAATACWVPMTNATTVLAAGALALAACTGDVVGAAGGPGDADLGEPGGADGAPIGDDGDDDDLAPRAPPATARWGNAVVTAYTFQDNSACNSVMTSSGRALVPYVSVALPFRYLRSLGGGPFELGDEIFVSFLRGRAMPDGSRHTGWVRIDDFCGDSGDDEYCFQDGEPNVDLYIGDWAASGMRCLADDLQDEGSGSFSGPAGDGQEPTEVRFGPAPAGGLVDDYGGRALGDGPCGDCRFGKTVQPPACWHYDPGDINAEYCTCENSNGRDGEC
jgi:hypothetical protein